MFNDDINEYIPSILNPRTFKKDSCNITLTQNSTISRSSLSLRKNRKSHKSQAKNNKVKFDNKENAPIQANIPEQSIDFIGSIGFSAIEDLNDINQLQNETRTQCLLSNIFSPPFAEYQNKQKPANEIFEHTCNSYNINNERNKNCHSTISVCEIISRSQSELHETMDDDDELKRCSGIETLNRQCSENTNNSGRNMKYIFLNREDSSHKCQQFTNVIVHHQNCNLVKCQISNKKKLKRKSDDILNVLTSDSNCLSNKCKSNFEREKRVILKRSNIPDLKSTDGSCLSSDSNDIIVDSIVNEDILIECYRHQDMNVNLANSPVKCESAQTSKRTSIEISPKTCKAASAKHRDLPIHSREIKLTNSVAKHFISLNTKAENSLNGSDSQTKLEAVQLQPSKNKLRNSKCLQNVIVAGTPFAVNAFCYGELKNVKHYFLTNYHVDNYAGLSKLFTKTLWCSKITAELCTSRLGVSSKRVHIMKLNKTIQIEGFEVTAVDANHCPGAIMLVFSLPNGKTILHTGYFRASFVMESYPIFWNKDIHTIYLDTTYCKPRYNFPTEDYCVNLAVYLLEQKKMAMERAGKVFSKVLIICGICVLGKDNFFMQLSHRVGCNVWAYREKAHMLQIVHGRTFRDIPPHSCQMHLVPTHDLTHEILHSYLENYKEVYSEVVAFKLGTVSNQKDSSATKDCITIHSISYSEHSNFSELMRFVKFLNPKKVIPTIEVSGGHKSIQKYFSCPLVSKDEVPQTFVTEYLVSQKGKSTSAVT